MTGSSPPSELKVMVGTLHSGEREFEESRRSIQSQTYDHLEHVVISGHPNKEAHALLYQGFLASQADILVKVDADMVLLDADFIDRIVDNFAKRPEVDVLAIAILDFFSGEEMVGVNAYRRTVDWQPARQLDLFTDSGFRSSSRLVIGGDLLHSCIHSPNPSPFQAFHFGVHRGLKVALSAHYDRESQAATQAWYLERTWENFLVRGDNRLGLACLGFELALTGRYGPADIDYTSTKLRDSFPDLDKLSTTGLRDRVRELRARSASVEPVATARTQFRGTEFHRRKEMRRLQKEVERASASLVRAENRASREADKKRAWKDAEKRARRGRQKARKRVRRASRTIDRVRHSLSWRFLQRVSRTARLRGGDPLQTASGHIAAADRRLASGSDRHGK
jgi:hypothetical protein